MRVLSAWPRRSSVERSSSETGERLAIPSLTAIGSAPQTPMRQPASIVWPFASAISSTVAPGLATTRVPSATNVTSGAPDRIERERVSERPAAADSPPARAAASAWNCASFWNVRRTQAAVSASTATRSAHVTASGDGSPVIAAHEVGPAEPVEDVEGDRAVERRELVRRDLHERVEQLERRDARRHVERDAPEHLGTPIASGASGTLKNASTRPGNAATKNRR